MKNIINAINANIIIVLYIKRKLINVNVNYAQNVWILWLIKIIWNSAVNAHFHKKENQFKYLTNVAFVY